MKQQSITIGSLFAGIGGFELGFESTGRFETLWQVERDKYASRVLAKHWPDVQRHDDVCTWPNETTKPVDVLLAGFPCQDISYAGKGAGLNGERSGLFFEVMRIVSVLGPKFIVLENVAALLTRGLDKVLGSLASHGYDAEWEVVPAASVGAPHRRNRVFIIGAKICDSYGNGESASPINAKTSKLQGDYAHAESNGRDKGKPNERGSRKGTQARQESRLGHGSGTLADSIGSGTGHESLANGRQKRKSANAFKPATLRQGDWETLPEGIDASSADCGTLADSDGQRGRSRNAQRQDAENARQSPRRKKHGGWDSEPAVGRVANGVPKRVDRLRCLGNAIVPQVAQVVAERLLEIHEANA